MTEKTCRRCVLVEAPPDIVIGDDGICSICKKYDQEVAQESNDRGFLETDFLKILDKHRGKQKYDCLCMLSGGKDSTASCTI